MQLSEPARYGLFEVLAMSTIRTILHPTDFSPHSEAAFQVAYALAREQGARLIALHVAVPPVVMYDEKGALLPKTKDYREVAKETLATLLAPGIKLEQRIEEGEVGVAILRTADEIKADFIVMGTQGRTGLDRLLIGSVASDVLRKASCPVVTVRVPRHK
jgi:nucleotide-binding universal stress UspA family protein